MQRGNLALQQQSSPTWQQQCRKAAYNNVVRVGQFVHYNCGLPGTAFETRRIENQNDLGRDRQG